MSGLPLMIGSSGPWGSGRVGTVATCVLAPNPSAMTLDGTNTWLLVPPGGRDAVLVDPGPADENHLAAVRSNLDELDARVATILLTHGHLDHSAGAGLFSEGLGAPVRALDPAHRLGEEGLTAGESVSIGDLDIEVVGTPGHSSDSLSFRVRDHAMILTGDTVLGRGTTVVAHPDGSLAQYMESLNRLQDLIELVGSPRLLPGHGPAVENAAELLSDYVSHRHERLEQVRRAIQDGATSAMDVVERVYQPIPTAVIPAALASVRAQWDYIVAEGT